MTTKSCSITYRGLELGVDCRVDGEGGVEVEGVFTAGEGIELTDFFEELCVRRVVDMFNDEYAYTDCLGDIETLAREMLEKVGELP
jgi:hypothetical protein